MRKGFRKFVANVTDWFGWFFVEVADKMFWLTNGDWAWNDRGDPRWFVWPYNWIANRIYDLGNWFYGIYHEHATGWTKVDYKYKEPFGQHHGAPALDLAGRINDITSEIMSDIEDARDEGRNPYGEDVSKWERLMQEAHWLSHEFECRLGGHGGTEYATGPLLTEEKE